MSQYFRSVSRSRRSGGVLLLVGVLAGVTVGGGVGVIAASSTKTVTVCADKKTGMLRYAKNGKCAKTETKVLLNQTGADGVAGVTGAKGETSAKGTDGAPGADGVNGVNGAAGSSFSARSVCGADGTTLCEVGLQGPGGGIVFFADTEGKYGDFDYLEVALDDLSVNIPWSTATLRCGLTQDISCRTTFLTTSGEALNFLAIGTGRAATAAIVARHEAGNVLKASYAAGVADEYATTTASDWWLPSRDELNELCKYARDTNQVAGSPERCEGGTIRSGFAGGLAAYWSSSEATADLVWAHAFNYQPSYLPTYNESFQSGFYKPSSSNYVRPVRGF